MLNLSVSLLRCALFVYIQRLLCLYVCRNTHGVLFELTFVLIFFSSSSVVAADQTPTPTTRFIRNCEEFGIFDDLKHVNPFEETFRQAIDCTTKRPSVLLTTQNSLEVIKSNDEDTLNTPHIIPKFTITDKKVDSPKIETKHSNDTEIPKQSISDKRPIVIVTNDSAARNSNAVSNANDKKEDITVIVEGPLPPKIIKIDDNAKVITTTSDITPKIFRKICPKPIVPIVSNPIKEKIRESLLKLRSPQPATDSPKPDANNHIPITDESDTQTVPKVEVKPQLVKRNIITFSDNTAVERNREAAKRYRNKQKKLHDALEERNKQLEAENAMLRKQLQLFKKAHQHCSVSLYQI